MGVHILCYLSSKANSFAGGYGYVNVEVLGSAMACQTIAFTLCICQRNNLILTDTQPNHYSLTSIYFRIDKALESAVTLTLTQP